MNPFTLVGAIIGGFVGALLWAIAMASTGGGWGGLALLVGAGASAAAILCGSRPNHAIVVAIITLVLCLCAKGVGLVITAAYQRDTQVAGMSYTEEEYTGFMDDAVEFTSVQPTGYANFIVNRKFYDTDLDGVASPEEQRRFTEFWAPRLQQWAESPPAMVDWAPALRDAYAAENHVKGDFGQVTSAHFGPLAVIAMLLAVVGAYFAVFLISTTDASLLERDERVVKGVIDLNADVGTRINIQMAAPGQKATRKNDTRITDRVLRAKAGRPTGQVLKKAPPKNELRDQPPGMK